MHAPRRTRLRAAAAVLIAGAAALTASACGGDDPSRVVGSASPGVSGPTSGPGTGDLLVVGSVLDDGEPLAGAEVNLLVYPARPDPGADGPTASVEIPPTTTGAQGRFAVVLPSTEVPGEYLAPLPDGSPRLEFAVVVDDGERVSSFSEIAALVAAGGDSTGRVWRTPGASGADAVLDIAMDLTRMRVRVTDSTGDASEERLPSR